MEEVVTIERDSNMCDRNRARKLQFVLRSTCVEEHSIAEFKFIEIDRHTLGELLISITQQIDADHSEQRLHQAGAVVAKGGSAAP